MSRIGTDVVALAAILGSAVVGGVVTLAAFDRPDAPGVADCVAASVVSAPRVVVSSGHNRHSIVISPGAHVRTTGTCVDMVIVDEMVQADLDRALAELDVSRMKLGLEYEQDIERRLNEEMAKLEKELARLGDDVGR